MQSLGTMNTIPPYRRRAFIFVMSFDGSNTYNITLRGPDRSVDRFGIEVRGSLTSITSSSKSCVVLSPAELMLRRRRKRREYGVTCIREEVPEPTPFLVSTPPTQISSEPTAHPSPALKARDRLAALRNAARNAEEKRYRLSNNTRVAEREGNMPIYCETDAGAMRETLPSQYEHVCEYSGTERREY
ncbi:hypothetical protein D9756_006866 [Leucocoprinus leucothites]|uniref:Uncharacterized protein n=1 Tax=Leucocoprinus leucothites TaxID=201217 RepID=A0A8H5G210_9AGAR|nr:hypothetical protein D9756_006866 [Leucoagaricus leucothites]